VSKIKIAMAVALVGVGAAVAWNSLAVAGEPASPTQSTGIRDFDDARAKTEAFAPRLVGLSMDAATDLAAANNMSVRATIIDGEPQAMTMDLRSDRINVELQNDIVIRIMDIG
jgi:hypothetical protein